MCRKSTTRRAAQPVLAAAFAGAAGRMSNVNSNVTPALPPDYSQVILTARGNEAIPVQVSDLEKDLKNTHLSPAYDAVVYDNKQPQQYAEEEVNTNPAELPAYLQPQQQYTDSRGADGCNYACGRRRTAGCGGAHDQRGCGNCCGTKSQGIDIARTQAMVDAYKAEPLQRDLQAFNLAMVDVRTGQCSSKGKAKRAVRQLRKHLVEVETGRRGGKYSLDCRTKKQLKVEARETAAVFMREIREAWRAAP